jgi:hypothetical protein
MEFPLFVEQSEAREQSSLILVTLPLSARRRDAGVFCIRPFFREDFTMDSDPKLSGSPTDSSLIASEVPREWRKWADIRARGSRRFIFLAGVLGWGLPVAILWAALTSRMASVEEFVTFLIPAIVLFPIGGYVWGLLMWKWMELRFARAKR